MPKLIDMTGKKYPPITKTRNLLPETSCFLVTESEVM